jgi:hypothetical protein
MEIWDEVIKEYNNELNRLKNVLGEGGAESFSHYRQIVGHIQVLSGVEKFLQLF